MSYNYSVEGKTFLITGAASGLGAGFAEKFLEEGAKHVAILDVALEVGLATANKLKAEFGDERVTFYRCDVTDENVLRETFTRAIEQLGTIDVVINNAGIFDDSPAVFRIANEVNWQALVTLSVLAWEHMRRDRGGAGGTLINISSTTALAPWPYLPIYSGAKAGVLHFSTCLGMTENYERSGVRVLCMCFGQTDTPLVQGCQHKSIDAEMGVGMATLLESTICQNVEAAVEGLVSMVRLGKPGGVWISMENEPAKDITDHIKAAYAEIAKAVPRLYAEPSVKKSSCIIC